MKRDSVAPASSRGAVRTRDIAVMGLLGPDIFISYRKREAPDYARALRDALEARGYRCFLDEDWQPPSYDIELYKRAARRSRMFVLVGSATVLDSAHIPAELEAYERGHAGLLSRHWRRIFPISVDEALAVFENPESGAPYRGTRWAPLLGLVSEKETATALASGRPSEIIPNQIARTYGLVRGTRLLLAALSATLVLVMSATAYGVWRVHHAAVELGKLNEQIGKASADLRAAEDETKRQRLAADSNARSANAYSRADDARRTPEHDEHGNPNTGRMLTAIESWRASPNPAAFQLISMSLTKVALQLTKWRTGFSTVALVAIDPRGQRVAASDGRSVRLFGRNGKAVSRRLPAETMVAMAFADSGKELVAAFNKLDGGEVVRLNATNGNEVGRAQLGAKYVAALSGDGEWVAAMDGPGVEVIPTRRQDQQKRFPYHSPCFAGSEQVVMVEDVDGAKKFVSGNLNEPTSLRELSGDVDPFVVGIESCGGESIVYHLPTSPPVVYRSGNPKLSAPLPWWPEHVAFGDGALAGVSPWASGHLFVSAFASSQFDVLKYFSAATAVAFGPPHEFVTGGADGTVTLWDDSDPRELADARGFATRWAQIPYRDAYLNGRFRLAAPFLSPGKRWRVERTGSTEVAIVDAASGYEVLLIDDQFSEEAAFREDEKAVALRSSLGMKVWSLDPELYLRSLCRALPALFDPLWNAARFENACRVGPAPQSQVR